MPPGVENVASHQKLKDGPAMRTFTVVAELMTVTVPSASE